MNVWLLALLLSVFVGLPLIAFVRLIYLILRDSRELESATELGGWQPARVSDLWRDQ